MDRYLVFTAVLLSLAACGDTRIGPASTQSATMLVVWSRTKISANVVIATAVSLERQSEV
jgi:hypothetical protein